MLIAVPATPLRKGTSITRNPPARMASATGSASSGEENVTAGSILCCKAVYNKSLFFLITFFKVGCVNNYPEYKSSF
jgi:hypothetical protein